MRTRTWLLGAGGRLGLIVLLEARDEVGLVSGGGEAPLLEDLPELRHLEGRVLHFGEV